MMWDQMDMNGWWAVWMVIMMIVFWGGLIALLVWGVRMASSAGKHSGSPLEIAGRRYASGEITRQEYEELRSALVKPAHGPGGSPA